MRDVGEYLVALRATLVIIKTKINFKFFVKKKVN